MPRKAVSNGKVKALRINNVFFDFCDGHHYWVGMIRSEPFFAAGMDKLKQCSVFSMTTSEGEGFFSIIFGQGLKRRNESSSNVYIAIGCNDPSKAEKKPDSFKHALKVKHGDAGNRLRLVTDVVSWDDGYLCIRLI